MHAIASGFAALCDSLYIPAKLLVHGDAVATASNIAAHEWLFRFGIVSSLTGGLVLIFLVLAFFFVRLGEHQNTAASMLWGVWLLPQYEKAVFLYGQPAFLGELALMLWLLIKGARPPAQLGA